MAAPSDWSATDLCIDADLVEFEGDVLDWVGDEGSAGKWRDKAKELIGERLDLHLRSIEIDTDTADVKDLVSNLGQLKNSACYLSLHLLALDVSHGAADMYDRKAEIYMSKYEAALQTALALLHVDTDESGTIEDSEKYGMPTGITLKHGG
jgi:hypothetical protein